jgi:hypothetical protein
VTLYVDAGFVGVASATVTVKRFTMGEDCAARGLAAAWRCTEEPPPQPDSNTKPIVPAIASAFVIALPIPGGY